MADNSENNLPPTTEETATGGVSIAPETVAGGSGGIEGGTYTPVYGRRKEKIYSINEDELEHLFLVGIFTAICFSIMSFLLAVAFNIHLSLSLAQALPENKAVYWTTVRDFALIISLFFLVSGILVVFFGRNRIKKIKENTIFP